MIFAKLSNQYTKAGDLQNDQCHEAFVQAVVNTRLHIEGGKLHLTYKITQTWTKR